MDIKTINNPIFLASALQISAQKIGYDIVHTYLNTSTISDKRFNPVFLRFRAEKAGELKAYIDFRTTAGYGGSDRKFSSVAIQNSSFDKEVFKKHIEDYKDDVLACVNEVLNVIKDIDKI